MEVISMYSVKSIVDNNYETFIVEDIDTEEAEELILQLQKWDRKWKYPHKMNYEIEYYDWSDNNV